MKVVVLGGFCKGETSFRGDVNTLSEVGLYYVGDATNTPAGYCHLFNCKNPGNRDRFQIACPSASNSVYVRGSDGDTWQPWMKIALEST